MRTLTLVLSSVLAITAIAPSATADKAAPVAKPKATVASITAKRDTLVKVRDELRAVAAKPAPPKLTPAETKARERFIAKVRETANDADALATKLTDGLKDKNSRLDALSELAAQESMRLQVAIDRESQLLQTLSNALKKEGDTANQIIQNLK